jgi:hypothetical protein
VHPVHTEAVAGIVGRADILAHFFGLVAMLCYSAGCGRAPQELVPSLSQGTRGVASPGTGARAGSRDAHGSGAAGATASYVAVAAAVGAAACGTLCKETGICVVAILTVLDVVVICGKQPLEMLAAPKRDFAIRQLILCVWKQGPQEQPLPCVPCPVCTVALRGLQCKSRNMHALLPHHGRGWG